VSTEQTSEGAGRRAGEVRNTRQRRAVEEALASLEDFHSAQQLHRIINDAGQRVSLATVYRVLQSLESSGDVDVLQGAEGQALYRRCAAEEHHHHLLCRSCGTAEDIEADAVERWARETGAAFGFTEIQHTVEITGLCARCSRLPPEERGPRLG
jgi:Fur family ferric uptake transcriptional regulator